MKKYFASFKNGVVGLATMTEVKDIAFPIGVGMIALSGWIVAAGNQRQIEKMEAVDRMTDGWVKIKIHPRLMEDVHNGAILMYREKLFGPGHLYTQATTNGVFSDEANENFKNKGETNA